MPAGVCRCWTLCCRWTVRSFAKVSRGGSTRAPRWRWNFPAARHGWLGTQTPQAGPLPLPAVDESLWTQLTLCREASAARVAEALYPADLTRQADFYSELCTKRSRGRAVAWTLEQGSTVVCTVGAYALCNGQAYMACGQTAEPLRGKGIGGRLIVQMANELSAEAAPGIPLCTGAGAVLYPPWLCKTGRVRPLCAREMLKLLAQRTQ